MMQKDHVVLGYIDLIKKAHFEDLEIEKVLCGELLKYAREKGDEYGIGAGLTYMGEYYITIHDMESSGRYLKEALEYGLKYHLEDLLMVVYNFYGVYCNYIHDDMTAFEYFLKGLELARKLDDDTLLYRYYNNIASSFQYKRDYKTALFYFEQAYQVLQKQMDQEELPYQHLLYLLQNLVNCSIALGDRAQVDEYCIQIDKLYKERPETLEDPSILYQRAVLLSYYGESEDADAILNDVLSWEEVDPLDAYDIIELYPIIFELLIAREEKEMAWKILKSLGKYLIKESPQAKQEYLSLKIRFYKTFGMEEELGQSYEEYYEAAQEALDSIAKNRVDAMKEKLQSFEMQEKIKKLQEITYIDDLSELYNRRYYSELLAKYIEDPSVHMLGLIIVDIDCFKEYNDHYGHDQGDVVIKQVADCLKSPDDGRVVPCRYGGDEFTCVCTNMTEGEVGSYLAQLYERLDALHIPHRFSPMGRVTVSSGYSVHESQLEDVGHIFHEADRALYRAKVEGKNRCCSFRELT